MEQQFGTNGMATGKGKKNTEEKSQVSPNAADQFADESKTKGQVIDGYIQNNVSDDPLMRFIYKYKTQLIFALAIITFGYYANVMLNQSKVERLQNASNLLEQVKVEYAKLEALPATPVQETNKEDSKLAKAGDKNKEVDQKTTITNKLKEQLKVLSSQPEPYKTMGANYDALLAIKNQKWEDLKNYLDINKLDKINPKAPERFYAELTNLTIIKALLGQEKYQETAVKYLQTLANDAEYVSVSAYKVLESFVGSLTEKTMNIDLAKIKTAISTKHPELAAQVE